jgi:glycosyltransferase involved in cell wall biosynthesis
MRNLFGTADEIGTETGGGIVTGMESRALGALGHTDFIDARRLNAAAYRLPNSPYVQDYLMDALVLQLLNEKVDLAHFYSGMFGKTIWRLKNAGVKVTQTIAAHDSQLSREEFQKLGISYDFPHLNERHLFLTYVEGQLLADKVICPSMASKRIVESYGVRDALVIPHGVVPPDAAMPMPTNTFHVGYLGQVGPDKGLIYLLEAWSKLNLVGNHLLLAGRDVAQLAPLWNRMGGKGEVEFLGWVEFPLSLYGRCSVYVQPSVTEGFGIEVLEAMAHGRPVIVSEGAGAADVVREGIDGFVVPRRNPDAIADCVLKLKNDPNLAVNMGLEARERAMQFTWDKILPQYQALWRSLYLAEKTREARATFAACVVCHGSQVCQDCRAALRECNECGGTGVCQVCKE